MKISMKKIYAYALGAALFLGLAAVAPSAHASSAVFNNNMYGVDCPTVAVANATTGTPTDSNNCWGTSVSATSNDVVNVIIYYNNNGSETARNVVARLSPKSAGVSSTQVFNGSISASNAATVNGTGTVSINPAHSITFGTVKWYKDKQGSPSPLPGGQTGAELFTSGLNLGDVLGGETCPVIAGVRDVACHEGWLMVSYRVGITASQPCVVSITANPLSIQAGQTSTLSWNSTNCTTVNVAGPNGVVGTGLTGSQPVSPQYTSTYTITGSGSTGAAAPVSTTITVNPIITPICTATLSPSGTQQVQAGQTSTLTWSSTGASYVTVTGPNGIVSSALAGSIPTAPIYGAVTYTLTAGCAGSSNVVQSVTFNAYTVNNGTAPTATTLAAQVGTDGVAATLNGYINSNTACTGGFWGGCGSSNVTYYFKYGTSQYGLYNQTPTQSMSSTSGNVSAYLSNLQPNTTYYFQLIASNTYGTSYGTTLSFVTNNGASNVSAITTIPTSVTQTSARLNGLVTGSSGSLYTGIASVWFDYGTSPTLGSRTNTQTVNISNISNYFDTIATSPNTTYYYRIVATVNGQNYTGSTVSFSTPAILTTTNTNTNTTTTIINRVGTGTGSAFLQLAITDSVQSVIPGDTLSYVVTYQNISGVTLSNVVINVILPTGVTFRQASQGLLTTNNTVATTVGTLLPAASGTFTIQVTTSPTIVPGNTLLTTATAAFTLPTSAQDSAIAYDLDNVVTFQNNLAGLALFGAGFFPTTLFGWILLLGLLLILILIARYFYQRSNATRAVPPANMHYETQTSTHTGYRGDNLPH